jgi:hypothetical protein
MTLSRGLRALRKVLRAGELEIDSEGIENPSMPIDESLRTQIETYLTHLNGLIRRGREVREKLADLSDPAAMAATRAWQEDCGVSINQLSGGSKSHWLARSFSGAFLVRSAEGRAAEGAPPTEIVNRLIDVLEQAIAALSGMENGAHASEFSPASAAAQAPAPRRFEFVRNSDLRPVLEQAYADSRQALEQKDYDLALRTSCSILEAIVTEALECKGADTLTASGAPPGKIGDWPFETRLAVAERTGLIRGGCARLPSVARKYRDHLEANRDMNQPVSEREARQTGQVLQVIMRDLNPTR